MQWLNIFYCFINYHFGFIYFLKIANWRQKGKYKNNSAIFLSPKMLQPIILETTLNFIFGLQLSSKWSPNGLLFTSKVVSIWSPMETFSSLPISSQPCQWLLAAFLPGVTLFGRHSIPLNLVGNNLLFFLVEAFWSKEFKLKILVLGEYLCQMWSCLKIVRIADEVSPYVW